jgi:hypothetical protein
VKDPFECVFMSTFDALISVRHCREAKVSKMMSAQLGLQS